MTACLIKSPVNFKISGPTPRYREYIYSKSKKTVTSENISGWGDNSTRCEKSSLYSVTFIDLRFNGLLTCPDLLRDWLEFNKHFKHFSGVHSSFLNTLTPKIRLLILPSGGYTFACKLVWRIWYQFKITTST